MEFRGKAKPLTVGGIEQAANTAGVDVPTLLAIMEVETAGCGFLPCKRPIILFERHIFSRRTGGAHDKDHPSISNPVCGGYGQSGALQYERLSRAMRLDEEAALYSTSWGLGQIMGFNYARVGYANVRAMIRDFADSEDLQLHAMAFFIRNASLSDELARKDWASFAYSYNGPGFMAHDYDKKLAFAYAKWSKRGLFNCALRAQQIEMRNRGYYRGQIDGIFGPLTKDAFSACEKAGWYPGNCED